MNHTYTLIVKAEMPREVLDSVEKYLGLPICLETDEVHRIGQMEDNWFHVLIRTGEDLVLKLNEWIIADIKHDWTETPYEVGSLLHWNELPAGS